MNVSATHACHANAQCSNTVGSFTCGCNSGYQGSGFLCTGKCLILTSNNLCDQ